MSDEKEDNRVKTLIEGMKKERGHLPPAWVYAAENDIGFRKAF